MSTKTTLAHCSEWQISTEPRGEVDAVAVSIVRPSLIVEADYGCSTRVTVTLDAALLDAIARLHADGEFPHQQREGGK